MDAVLSLQVNRAVRRCEENTPLEEDICLPSKMSKKPTEQVMPCVTLTKLQLNIHIASFFFFFFFFFNILQVLNYLFINHRYYIGLPG